MSTIQMHLVKVNGLQVDLTTTVHTHPRGSDRENIENKVESRLISQIDRKISHKQELVRFR